MKSEKLNDNEVREIAQMQKTIDTLESAIISLHQVANGNKDSVSIIFTTMCDNGVFERMYCEIRDKLIELQDGRAE